MPVTRIISGVIAIILAISVLSLGGIAFAIGIGILAYLAQQEYFQLVQAKGIEPAIKSTMVATQLLLLCALLAPNFVSVAFPIAGAAIFCYLLFQPKLASIADMSTSILGLFYGGLLPSYWIRLRVELDLTTPISVASNTPLTGLLEAPAVVWLTPGLLTTLLAFCCIWAADIGAYFFGKSFGKTRLSAVSPKKTVEGAVFGILSSTMVGAIGAFGLNWALWLPLGLVFGLIVGIASLVGDLTESLMKRDAGVKDSGQLIPGHGGILDRTDSYIFTAPLVYYFVTLILPLVPHSL
ncbi:MAG: phosphatidate cytidylyltransferase [Oscillatoriales cyanobacterium]|nr:MAG: phosphatidate cytidylyltransferase [Oscillatoriales cyanobacterium]